MRIVSTLIPLSIVGALLGGCAAAAEEPEATEATATSEGELRNCPVETQLCVVGWVWSQAKCACVPKKLIGGGGACGANTCGAGEFCCNASCGICAPFGGACTQQFCGDTM